MQRDLPVRQIDGDAAQLGLDVQRRAGRDERRDVSDRVAKQKASAVGDEVEGLVKVLRARRIDGDEWHRGQVDPIQLRGGPGGLC